MTVSFHQSVCWSHAWTHGEMLCGMDCHWIGCTHSLSAEINVYVFGELLIFHIATQSKMNLSSNSVDDRIPKKLKEHIFRMAHYGLP